ncbi:YIF1-domain-containing protein [Pyronema omphalodes]|nr:YIF1-domain-containing protein [Pyronema omphalodes]
MYSATPPIHHPVPQRPVQVPVMQSPPPPSQSSDPYDIPYGGYGSGAQAHAYPQQGAQAYPQNLAPQPGGNNAYGQQFGAFAQGASFFNDPMAAPMAFNMARAAMGGSTEIAGKNISRYFSTLKPFFAVTNTYVIRKLYLLINPWRHSPWSRQSTTRASANRGETETVYLQPREDINAPDMYIPLMSFVTYILLSALLYGLSGTFHPEMLGYTASSALGAVMFELVCLKLGCYLLSIGNSTLLDLVAYSGYKFVGVIFIILATAMMGSGWISWAVFGYFYLAQAFFLLRSLKYVLLPEDGQVEAANGYPMAPRQMRKRRTWFLFGYSYVVQFIFMMTLTSGVGKVKGA